MKLQGQDKIIIASKKKNGLRIFLDMDGVVAFWEKSAAKTLDIDLNDEKIREEIKNGKRMETYVGGDENMWPLIKKEGDEWWENIELLPWAKRLYNMLKEKADYFSFLSSPSNDPLCASGKVKFLRKHFGDDFKDFLIGRNKYMCASKNALLVDDDKGKTKKFKKFGGYIFQWPSPLELLDGDIDVEETFDELSDYIKEIRGKL